MTSMEMQVLKARTARAFPVPAGTRIAIVNTHGTQVVDTWAFCATDFDEFMSMEHTRVHAGSPVPRSGVVFRTNRRRPILAFVVDTSPGVHDWFYAACDRQRYEMLGFDGHHDNCTDNFHAALASVGHDLRVTPCPLNLFENAPFLADGDMAIRPPVSRPGDRVELEALMDVVVILSACPQDMVPTNGAAMMPSDIGVQIIRPRDPGHRTGG